MLSGNVADYCKTMCPVCEINYQLKDFKVHMLDTHPEFSEAVKFTDETYSLLYKSTSLKNVTNFVYYNWDYHIQIKYEPTEDDKINYQKILDTVKNFDEDSITNEMANFNPLFAIKKLALNVFRILSS